MVTGVCNTAISYLSFTFLLFIGIHYLLASIGGFFLAIVFSFHLNKKWTFNSTVRNTPRLVGSFFMINLLALASSLCVLHVLHHNASVNIYLAQAFALIVSMVVNFVGYNFIFNPNRKCI
nr:GtrA family protein [Vibrio sp. 03-59-1]